MRVYPPDGIGSAKPQGRHKRVATDIVNIVRITNILSFKHITSHCILSISSMCLIQCTGLGWIVQTIQSIGSTCGGILDKFIRFNRVNMVEDLYLDKDPQYVQLGRWQHVSSC